MSTKAEVWQGTLALMVLKTLHAMGPQHGYGIARRIEQTSDNLLSINHGQKQLDSEVTQWAQATEIVARFIALKGVKL
jgi:hypothetical protein